MLNIYEVQKRPHRLHTAFNFYGRLCLGYIPETIKKEHMLATSSIV